MIPKKIHYCWFGGKELPPLAKKCIESWKKYCPDYEIIEWNEKNFDININQYTKEAYDNKKWAFVSDVARIYALYNHGGIYMDTDVEIIKNIDEFLNDKAFIGFEAIDRIQTGIIACQKGNKIIKEILDDYDTRKFVKENGELDTATNVYVITSKFEKNGLKKDNTYQKVNDFTIYPTEYFCPLDYDTRKLNVTDNSYVIHWFDGSWVTKKDKIKYLRYKILVKIFGKKNIDKVIELKNRRKK